MDYTQIIQWVVWGIVLLYATITTVINVVNKIRNRKAAGEKIDIDTVFKDIVDEALNAIEQSEKAYQLICKDGAKAGVLKQSNVLTQIERLCRNKGIAFDLDFWESFVDKTVEVMNVNKLAQSSQLDKVSNVQFYGGEK